MRKIIILAAVLALGTAAASPSALAPVAATIPLVPGESPVVVMRFVEHMRDNMHLGTYPDGTPMRAEPPEERSKPIISRALAQRIYDRGTLSGNITACGGDWQTMSYKPLMTELEARGDLSPKQLGFATMLHNAAQEQGKNVVDEDCTAEFKASVIATLNASKAQKG